MAAGARPDAPTSGPGSSAGSTLNDATFVVSGIHCAACSITIEQCLRALPGVESVEAHGASARVRLRWDPSRTGESDWAEALAPAGYALAPDRAAPARALRRAEGRALSWRLFVAALCSMQVMMLAAPSYGAAPGEIEPGLAQVLAWGQWVLSLPVMLFSAGPLLRAALAGLAARRLPMDVPVALGLLAAFVASSAATFDPAGVFGSALYFDSLTMFVALLLGARRLELALRHRAEEQLEAAGTLLPERALRVSADGSIDAVTPAELLPGDLVRVPLGEAVPADGVLLDDGAAALDEALLSGESQARTRHPGDPLWAGSVNRGRPLLMRITRAGQATRLATIESLLREARQRRPGTVRLADRWSGPFVAAVIVAALLAAVVWQLVDPQDPRRAIEAAVAVLVVTCPCALSLAVPLAQLAASQRLARAGVVVQRLEGLERLADACRVVFDKTGTLTTADPAAGVATTGAAPRGADAVTLRPVGEGRAMSMDVLWAMASALGQASHHPVAQAIAAASGLAAPAPAMFPKAPAPASQARPLLQGIDEVPGQGLRAVDPQGREWRLGSRAWVEAPALAVRRGRDPGGADDARAWLACEGRVLAAFVVGERLRDGAASMVADLRAAGLAVSLASGDAAGRVATVATALGIDDVLAEATPEAKLQRLASAQQRGEVVVAMGDGFNDGPLLAQADVAVAMTHGAMASQREAHLLLDSARADVLRGLPLAHAVARRARRVARQNLAWAAAYNAACIPLALVGWLPPWAAGVGMAASSAAVLLNAARLNR